MNNSNQYKKYRHTNIFDSNDPYYTLHYLFWRNRPDTVLRKLEDLLQDDGGIFKDDPYFIEFRSLILQYRINVLLEWNRYSEALAWLCLETEINPSNFEAMALKEQLKKRLMFKNVGGGVVIEKRVKKHISQWGPVVGMRRVKAIIERDLILPIKERELSERFNVSIPKGMLLYGPPGCGKTFIVKQIAHILNFNYLEISPSAIASTYVHGTQEKIRALFQEAEGKKPCLLFFDELDAFVPNRDRSNLNFHYQAEVNEFLIQLNNAYSNGIFVVGATNHLNLIDEAVKRPGRFDLKIFIGPPDIEARISAFKNGLNQRKNNITKWEYVGEETENYTFAEINYIIEQVARESSQKQKELIDLNDLMKVIIANPPEFDNVKIQSYL